jgi:hypothetical protein
MAAIPHWCRASPLETCCSLSMSFEIDEAAAQLVFRLQAFGDAGLFTNLFNRSEIKSLCESI